MSRTRWMPWLLLGLAVLAPITGDAQERGFADPDSLLRPLLHVAPEGPEAVIEGEVIAAETDDPVAGAVLHFPGTESGTVTDDEGRFTLKAPADTALELRAQIIGRITQDWHLDFSEGQSYHVRIVLVPRAVYPGCDLRVRPLE